MTVTELNARGKRDRCKNKILLPNVFLESGASTITSTEGMGGEHLRHIGAGATLRTQIQSHEANDSISAGSKQPDGASGVLQFHASRAR